MRDSISSDRNKRVIRSEEDPPHTPLTECNLVFKQVRYVKVPRALPVSIGNAELIVELSIHTLKYSRFALDGECMAWYRKLLHFLASSPRDSQGRSLDFDVVARVADRIDEDPHLVARLDAPNVEDLGREFMILYEEELRRPGKGR